MYELSDHQKRVASALEGNVGVWFNTRNERVAVWYGEPEVRIFDSRTWDEIETVSFSQPSSPHMSEQEALLNKVGVKLIVRGFDRQGRTVHPDGSQGEVSA